VPWGFTENELKGYQGVPLDCIPNGGIGSLAHLSDVFAFQTLSDNPSDDYETHIWVQADCAIVDGLRDMEPDTASYWSGGIAPVIMSFSDQSCYAQATGLVLEELNKDNRRGFGWFSAMRTMQDMANLLKLDIKRFDGLIDCGGIMQSPFTEPARHPYRAIHWSNASHGLSKDNPIPGSEYEKLLKENGLI
jgi:hypothetical protein